MRRVNVVQKLSNLYDTCCVPQFQMLFKVIFGGWLVNALSMNSFREIINELGIEGENILSKYLEVFYANHLKMSEQINSCHVFGSNAQEY